MCHFCWIQVLELKRSDLKVFFVALKYFLQGWAGRTSPRSRRAAQETKKFGPKIHFILVFKWKPQYKKLGCDKSGFGQWSSYTHVQLLQCKRG